MAVTTQEQEKKRLRSYLNPYIKGEAVDAVLKSLATASSYLVNSAQAVNNSLYVVTAQGVYLDLKLADYGISRDPVAGIGDEIFRTIGIQVKNRKQVRDLINNILDAVFGDQFVKATSNAQNLEPYALVDGDTLVINFDGANTSTITFSADQFTDIGAATAQEVADAISIGLSVLGLSGSAILNNDGNGNYVQLISSTIGATSSITVLGGRAQNVLLFDSLDTTNGNFSTQWSILSELGGKQRFTWTGTGANPNLDKLKMGDYVNIYGGGFASSPNQGTFSVLAFGEFYFEIYNPQGTTGVVTQGLFTPGNIDNVVQFYTPIRETILSKKYYGAVYQTQSNILQIFMPATTQVIQRSRIGAAFFHGVSEQPVKQLIFPLGSDVPSSGQAEYFLIDSFGTPSNRYVWLNVSGGSNMDPAPAGFTGIEVTINSSDSAATVANKAYTAIVASLPLLTYEVLDNVITITSVVSSTIPDAGPSTPSTLGSYVFDTQQGFVVGGAATTLTEDVNGESNRVITVASSDGFPNTSGYLVIGYGTELQEGPIPYIAVPSTGSILISPTYFIQNDHPSGSSVFLITQKAPVVLPSDGSYYQPYLTDTANGRVYAQNLINSITAAGVTVIYTILYPNDEGLGKWGTPYSEISTIYGP